MQTGGNQKALDGQNKLWCDERPMSLLAVESRRQHVVEGKRDDGATRVSRGGGKTRGGANNNAKIQ